MTMKNVHVIPTEKSSRLHLGNSGLVLCDLYYSSNTINSQHIYITNSEEIKEGDCVGYPTLKNWVPVKYLGGDLTGGEKKIILTTDQDLIKDGVQAIDDTFLEWFIKNPSCEEVEFEVETKSIQLPQQQLSEYSFDLALRWINKKVYKIIIPKKEPKQIKCYCGHTTYCDCSPLEEAKERAKNYMRLKGALEPKQETLEEAAENYAVQFLLEDEQETDSANRKHAFKEGAKWQQEQIKNESTADYVDRHIVQAMVETVKQKMYSEEEVIIMLNKFGNIVYGNYTRNEMMCDFVEQWFEQNKKK